jgi:hypothetical protein
MDGKVAIEEHFSTELNNKYWDAKGEEGRNGRDFTRDIERRLLDPDLCVLRATPQQYLENEMSSEASLTTNKVGLTVRDAVFDLLRECTQHSVTSRP